MYNMDSFIMPLVLNVAKKMKTCELSHNLITTSQFVMSNDGFMLKNMTLVIFQATGLLIPGVTPPLLARACSNHCCSVYRLHANVLPEELFIKIIKSHKEQIHFNADLIILSEKFSYD